MSTPTEDSRAVEPTEHLDTPLWVVYGPDCFPTMFCCKVLNHPTCGLVIWGYSVYRRQPGFRTLGQGLQAWLEAHEKPKFFARQDGALQHLAKITTPREPR
jgi:hypothetical protein